MIKYTVFAVNTENEQCGAGLLVDRENLQAAVGALITYNVPE
jgi:hypothetical protein